VAAACRAVTGHSEVKAKRASSDRPICWREAELPGIYPQDAQLDYFRIANDPGFVCTAMFFSGDSPDFPARLPAPYSDVAVHARPVFCAAGLIVDKLGIQL
jgi:hypothetical protein